MKRFEAWLPVGLLLVVAGSASAQLPAESLPPSTKAPALLSAKPLQDEPGDSELRKLQKARYNEAVAEIAAIYQLFEAGRGTLDSFVDAGKRLVQSGLDLYDKPADKITLLSQYVELTKAAEKIAENLSTTRGTMIELHQARYQRLDAEIQLLRAKQAAAKAK